MTAKFAVFFGLFAPLVLLAQDGATSRALCTVEGQISAAGSNLPVKKAEVALRPVPDEAARPGKIHLKTFVAESDANGKFRIEGIEPGAYRLMALKNGFVVGRYGAADASSPDTLITLSEGEGLSDANIQLTAQGVVAGRIVDENLLGLAGVEVSVERAVNGGAPDRSQRAGLGYTNDLGEYRIAGIPAGKYYVVAQNQPYRYSMGGGNADNKEGITPAYYPGTPDAAGASPVEVRSGSEVHGVDFPLRKTFTAILKGRVTGLVNDPAVTRTIALRPAAGSQWGSVLTPVSGVDGSFSIAGVLPGSYVLSGRVEEDGKLKSAELPIEVSRANLDNLVLAFEKGLEISGSFSINGAKLSLAGVGVYLIERHSPTMYGAPRTITARHLSEDGQFALQGVAASRYLMRTSGLPEDTYVKFITIAGKNYPFNRIDIAPDTSEIQINLFRDAAAVEGTVAADASNKPVPGMMVVLAPMEDKRNEYSPYRVEITDQNGHFAITTVPPGPYKLFAFSNMGHQNALDPDMLKPYESRGTDILIEAGGRYNTPLRVIPRVE